MYSKDQKPDDEAVEVLGALLAVVCQVELSFTYKCILWILTSGSVNS